MKRNLTILLFFLFIFTVLSGCTSENLTSLTEYIPRPTNYNKHIKVKIIPIQNQETGKTPSTEETINQTIDVFEKRLNTINKKNVLIKKEGEDQIIISVSENIDLEKVKEIIQQVGTLELKEQDPKTNSWRTVLTNTDLKPNSAKTEIDQIGRPYLTIIFNDEGKVKFAEITKRNIKKHVAIYIDKKEISSPIVASAILNGECQISSSNNITMEEFKNLEILINSGSLNADIQIIDINRDNEKGKK